MEFETQLVEDLDAGGLVLRLETESADVDVAVGERTLVVGRSRGCDLVIHAASVSRHHARITQTEAGFLVEDLGATNPCRVAGRPVVGSALVGEGDVLEICGTRLRVRRR